MMKAARTRNTKAPKKTRRDGDGGDGRFALLNWSRLFDATRAVSARNVDDACGYPQTINADDYRRMFYRGDVAARIVSLWPNETWAEEPYVIEQSASEETPFERAVVELNRRVGLWSALYAADVLSGIGRYGVLLLGFSDTDDLSLEVQRAEGLTLDYLRPLDETQVSFSASYIERGGERAGLPRKYDALLSDGSDDGRSTTKRTVHWTRAIHIADNTLGSSLYGVPRLMPVYNRLLDLRKLAGGSAEMFWAGGFPGLSLEATAAPDGRVKLDVNSLRDQLERYLSGLQRYMALVGMSAKSLAPQIADPRPHVEVQLRLIASALGVPWRVFQGSEAAQLASEQDAYNWQRQVRRRRELHAAPRIIRPVLDRLIEFGVLPAPQSEYIVRWGGSVELSETARTEMAERRTNALARYADSGAPNYVPPFHYLTEVLGFEDDVARAMLDEAGAAAEE